jgi:hypothetical protein
MLAVCIPSRRLAEIEISLSLSPASHLLLGLASRKAGQDRPTSSWKLFLPTGEPFTTRIDCTYERMGKAKVSSTEGAFSESRQKEYCTPEKEKDRCIVVTFVA